LRNVTERHLLDVRKNFNKQDMQNNMCITAVNLDAQKVFLSHKFTRRDIDNTLLETMPDIDQALLQFIDVMQLLEPLLHFSQIFVVNLVQICAVGWQKVW